jgi:butyryl-CoA dehydrogenase
MTARLVERRDLDFLLFEFLDCEALTARPRYADHSRETFAAALDSAHQIAADLFAPHNREADEHEPTFDGKRVSVVAGVKPALEAFARAGFIAAAHDYELGGMQLPVTLAQACFALFDAANVGTTAYPFLTIANANLINAFGSTAQKAKYLRALLQGRFFGTMALTEPQAGSSLSDIKTVAAPGADGTYLISGNKIFISGGDHELSENIVHLVLARIPGGPPGVKGISLFSVPKFLVNDDGTLGRRNDVALAGLIHKMGYRGATSTMLNFGERGQCVGELVGEPHRGLPYMFHMMNEARIGVGLGAAMLGYTGYLHALDYARGRPQGRLASAKNPLEPQVPIVQHPDVRRMLLAQKAYVEGALALCLYAARLVDEHKTGADEQARRDAGRLLDLLTPVVKSWPSQFCLEANSLAIQVLGGYGYTREYPVEQFYRDNRLNPIHEGTHGIQALDLLGRKVLGDDGSALALLVQRIDRSVDAARADSELAGFGEALRCAWADINVTSRALGDAMAGSPDAALANASVYLEMFGHSVVAWTWLEQALSARRALAKLAPGDTAAESFYMGKLAACRYFFQWELPKTGPQHLLLRALDPSCLDMREEWF